MASPSYGYDFVHILQHNTGFKQQWQINDHKIVTQYKILEHLLVYCSMNFRMCNTIQSLSLFDIVEYQFSNSNPVQLTVAVKHCVAKMFFNLFPRFFARFNHCKRIENAKELQFTHITYMFKQLLFCVKHTQ